MVDSSGKITARGGGNIAGWDIEDNKLSKGSVGMAPKNWIDNKNIYTGVFWAGAPDIETIDGKKKNIILTITGEENGEEKFYQRNFFVTQGGYLFSKKGQIAGWNIEDDKLYNENVGMAPKNWVLRTEKVKVEGTIQKRPIYTGVFWAGNPDEISSIQIPGTNSYFAKRNFFVTGKGFLFSKAGNIGGWKITADKLTNETENIGISTGIKLAPKDIRTVCFWSGNKNSNSTENMNFYVDTTGFLFSKYGQIGNWFIGSGGLYHQLGKEKIEITLPYSYNKRIIRLRQERDKTTKKGTDEYNNFNKRIKEIQKNIKDKKIKGTDRAVETITTKNFDNTIDIDYKNSQGGVYVGSDGIRLGEIFHVDSNGLYASKGNIGGIDITLDGLYSTNWQIDGSGFATFSGATINGSSINAALAISGRTGGGGITGGGMTMGSGGPSSSSISPDVMAQGKGKTWDTYINDKIKDAINYNNIIAALKDGEGNITFRDLTVKAEKFNGHKMEKSGSDLATETWVTNNYAKKSDIPATPTTPTTP